MDKSAELYHEENRKALIDLNKGVSDVRTALDELIKLYEPPKSEVAVTGELTVNTEKSVEVTNLELVRDGLGELGTIITKAIENNAHKPLEAVYVKNIADAKQDEIKITNLADLQKYFVALGELIKNNQPIVNVAKQDIVFPTSAKEAIPVRLSDGKSFYTAMATAVSGGVNTSGLATDEKLDEVITAVDGIGGSVKYVTLIDETTTANVTYIGKAVPTGSAIATSSAVWQITRIDESSSPTSIKYADGNTNFDNTFENLASKTYA